MAAAWVAVKACDGLACATLRAGWRTLLLVAQGVHPNPGPPKPVAEGAKEQRGTTTAAAATATDAGVDALLGAVVPDQQHQQQQQTQHRPERAAVDNDISGSCEVTLGRRHTDEQQQQLSGSAAGVASEGDRESKRRRAAAAAGCKPHSRPSHQRQQRGEEQDKEQQASRGRQKPQGVCVPGALVDWDWIRHLQPPNTSHIAGTREI